MQRALLVGIDHYDSYAALGGCVNDVSALRPLLDAHEDGDPNFECLALTSDSTRVTRDGLLGEVARLLAPGVNVALLYFGGHGVQRHNDVALVTTDGTELSPGVLLSEVLTQVQQSPVPEVVIVLDCCFSGAAGGVPQLGGASAAIREGISILTASRGEQTAGETPEGRGEFSVFFEGAMEGGAADVLGRVTIAGMYAYLSESFGAWDQRPTFKANVDRLHDLRRCRPTVPRDQLRQLPVLFPTHNHELSLNPSYEPTEQPRHEENERVFAILQRCRAAKLVEPVGTEHMYYAALESRACRLTPLGRHYRHMAERRQL